MATAKYFRGIGPLWNINKLRKELEASLGQAVTCAVSDDATTLTIEYTVPGADSIVDQVVAAHIAQAGYSIQAGNTGALFTNYGEFFYGTGAIEDGDATGIWGGFPAKEYPVGSGQFHNFMILSNGVLGTGASTEGITISSDASAPLNGINFRSFATPDISVGFLTSATTGTTPDRANHLIVEADAESGGVGVGLVSLNAYNGSGALGAIDISPSSGLKFTGATGAYHFKRLSVTPGATPSGYLQLFTDVDTPNFRIVTEGGQDSIIHNGDYVGYLSVVAASVTPTSGYTRTIKQDSMGTNGFFIFDGWFLVSNTGATSVACTFDVAFGGTSILTRTTGATGASTPRYIVYRVTAIIANVASASAQRCEVNTAESPASTDSATIAAASPGTAIKTASINTGTGDRSFDVTCTLSTATNSKVERLGATMYGPYYVA